MASQIPLLPVDVENVICWDAHWLAPASKQLSICTESSAWPPQENTMAGWDVVPPVSWGAQQLSCINTLEGVTWGLAGAWHSSLAQSVV